MEGFANSKDVDNYSILAKYYDELLIGDETFSEWLDYIEKEQFNAVLELASGTGVLAGILKNKGYDIIASDISEDMKSAARVNYDGEYLILNMIEYHLDKKFDLILCICDSFNYLNIDELDSFFKSAYEHLNENGRLIFDMHSISRLKEFEEEYIEEGFIDNIPYQWSIMSDTYDKQLYQHFTFYRDNLMIQEHHSQNVFEIDEVLNIMNKYFECEVIDDFVVDEKVLMIGRKIK